MKRWRWVLVVVVVALVAGGAYYVLQRRGRASAATATYDTAPVRKGNLVVTVTGAGSLAARRQINLLFGTTGRIAEVLILPGDVVKAGQPLMRLDSTDLEAEVAKARLSLANAENQSKKVQTGSTEADIAAARASLKSAEENMARVKAGATAADLAAAQAALATAQQAYDTLRSGADAEAIRDAELKLAQAKNSLWAAQANRDSVGGAVARGQGSSAQYDGAKASVANAEIAVQQAEIALAKAKEPPTAAQVQDAAAKVEQAKQNLDKLRAGATAADIASAEAQVATAQAKLNDMLKGATPEDVAIAKAQVETAQLNLKQAEKQLSDAVLRAPFNGIVLTVKADVGLWVNTGAVVGTLADLSALEIGVGLSELDVVRAEKGQSATVTLDSLPDARLRAHVERVAPAAEIQQGVATYLTTIVVDDSNPKVRPGMTANVTIVTDQRQNVLLAPNRAIRSRGRERVVATLKEGAIEWVVVQVGASNETMSEIKEGLQEGQAIVSNPPTPTTGARPGGQGGMGGPGFFMGPGMGR